MKRNSLTYMEIMKWILLLKDCDYSNLLNPIGNMIWKCYFKSGMVLHCRITITGATRTYNGKGWKMRLVSCL